MEAYSYSEFIYNNKFFLILKVKKLIMKTKEKEGSHSGLVRHLGKVVTGQLVRGFESPILRKTKLWQIKI